MPKSRKFIDRKKAITFHLVHRSQHDPLAADESAPQRVLLPVQEKQSSKGDVEKRKEEQRKYGVFFDDDYNYLQHLRQPEDRSVDWEQVEKVEASKNVKSEPQIQLPSSVFASEVEEEVGLLNKAAPQGLRLDLDPDVVAAMDDDFDYNDPDNQLEDNFIELANAGPDVDDEEEEGYEDDEDVDSNFAYSDEDRDELGSLDGAQQTYATEKSRFTEYSMSSSVIKRNELLTLLDNRFEKMYEAYDDTEVGPLDCEDIEGFIDPSSDLVLQCVEDFEKQRKREKLSKDEIVRRAQEQESNEDSNTDDEGDNMVAFKVPEKEKWDCESILSTYSNIYNRPKVIDEPKRDKKIKIHPRSGIPMDVLGQDRLTAKTLQKFNELYSDGEPKRGIRSEAGQSVISQLSALSIRNKDETPEEKKERKRLLKEYRKIRREEKKLNAEAFKEEAKRQIKIAINNKKNLQGKKIV